MAKNPDTSVKGDHLKYYCIVFGILVVVIAFVAIQQNKNLAAYRKATEIMCEEAPVVFLYAQPATYGVSTRVDYTARGDDWLRAFDMTPAN